MGRLSREPGESGREHHAQTPDSETDKMQSNNIVLTNDSDVTYKLSHFGQIT